MCVPSSDSLPGVHWYDISALFLNSRNTYHLVIEKYDLLVLRLRQSSAITEQNVSSSRCPKRQQHNGWTVIRTHSLRGNDGMQIIKFSKHPRICPVKVRINGILYDPDGMSWFLMQVDSNLFINIIRHIIGWIPCYDFCIQKLIM